jgi:hypothetical protein
MSLRSKKKQGSADKSRPTFFDQIGDDMRRHPPSIWKWKNQSIWPYLIGIALYVFWKMIHYR